MTKAAKLPIAPDPENPLARRPPRSRFQPQRVAGMRLEERDEQLLGDLFLQRAMARGQIEELYFSSTVRCNARLRQLFDHHFVERYYPPVAPFGAQAIYTVGKAALPLVARRLEMEWPEVTRFYRRGRTPTFIEHTLAIVDVWIAFRRATSSASVPWAPATSPHQAADGAAIQLERWLAEMLCRHEWQIRAAGGGSWHQETFKPDAFVRLFDGRDYRSYFIEVDLGHTSSRQFAGKLFTHTRYLESGLFEETYGTSAFETLVVTTGAKRLQNLKALVEASGSRLFRFSTWEALQASGALAPIWQSPFGSAPIPLL